MVLLYTLIDTQKWFSKPNYIEPFMAILDMNTKNPVTQKIFSPLPIIAKYWN